MVTRSLVSYDLPEAFLQPFAGRLNGHQIIGELRLASKSYSCKAFN